MGKSIAEEFYKEGALLALFDIQYDLIENLAKKLDSSGERVLAIKADVTDEMMIKDGMAKVFNKFDKIDISGK